MTLHQTSPRPFWIGVIALGLAGCTQTPGEISRDSQPFDGIEEAAIISVGGTEPFWGLAIAPESEGPESEGPESEGPESEGPDAERSASGGYRANYSTPDNPDGTAFTLSRFAGNNGLGFSGELEGKPFNLALTPGDCSDGMSDATYPYTATLLLGDETLYGCAHTDTQPFVGGEGA